MDAYFDQCCVFMIDDDLAQISVIRVLLQSVCDRDYRLQHACTLKSAIEHLEDTNIDVVLLDLNLPDSFGRATFDAVMAARPDLPIIILSGIDDEELSVDLVKNGAQDYLIKGMHERYSIIRSINFAIERKKIQEEKKQLQIRVEQESRLEALGTLASGVAHEINTPLQFIGTNLRFLKKSFESVCKIMDTIEIIRQGACNPEHLPKAFGDLEDVIRATKYEFVRQQSVDAIDEALDGVLRINSIVNTMNVFARRNKRAIVEYDVRKVMEETLNISRGEWKYIAEIKRNYSDSPIPVMCCPEELCQVFLNIIINAAHAIREAAGESHDKGDTDNARGIIEVTLRGNGETVEIWISDTGRGIPEEIRHRICEPFFTTKQAGQGLGLGLSIARGIVVDKHGGKFSFETELGRGTVFKIELPVYQPAVDTFAPLVESVNMDALSG